MTSPTPAPGAPRPDRIQNFGAASQSEKRTEATAGGAAFRALLEKLESQAQDLKNRTTGVEKPDELAGAVGSAQQSLEQALSLSEQLVEALRQSLQQNGGKDEEPRKAG